MTFKILQGDNRDLLKTIESNSIDAIVTDPPYGIDFLGKAWDANTGALETYEECLRVLKPGGHILAFSAARTYHHLAVTLEQAGFEIRDQIMWIYSSGFPKSQDIGKSIDRSAGKKNNLKDRGTKGTKGDKNVKNSPSSGTLCPRCGRDSNARYSCNKGQDCGMIYKPQTSAAEQWVGWGTALKPAHEPIALARKPMKQSIAKNCQQWGVGAINIDATRVSYEDAKSMPGSNNVGNGGNTFANFNAEKINKDNNDNNGQGWDPNDLGRFPSNVIGEIPDYQKYFYCPKVSRRERHVGFDTTKIPTQPEGKYDRTNDPGNGNERILNKGGNNHPTVKPVELMKYLITLITPPGGTVLDPFCGSGSTGMAAVELGNDFIGCELDPKYVAIADRRITAWQGGSIVFRELFYEDTD